MNLLEYLSQYRTDATFKLIQNPITYLFNERLNFLFFRHDRSPFNCGTLWFALVLIVGVKYIIPNKSLTRENR